MKRINKKKAQTSLELGLALIGVFLLLIAALNIFLWINKRFISRQQDYESKRLEAGSATSGREIQVEDTDKSRYPKLDIFKE